MSRSRTVGRSRWNAIAPYTWHEEFQEVQRRTRLAICFMKGAIGCSTHSGAPGWEQLREHGADVGGGGDRVSSRVVSDNLR